MTLGEDITQLITDQTSKVKLVTCIGNDYKISMEVGKTEPKSIFESVIEDRHKPLLSKTVVNTTSKVEENVPPRSSLQ